MSVQITFEGPTIDAVVEQARTFASAFGAVVTAATPEAKADAAPPAKTRKAKPEPKPDETTSTETSTEAKAEPSPPPADQSKDKEEALVAARKLYAAGAAGQEHCRRIAKKFGVKKLGDVAADSGSAFLDEVKKAQAEVDAAAPESPL